MHKHTDIHTLGSVEDNAELQKPKSTEPENTDTQTQHADLQSHKHGDPQTNTQIYSHKEI
uniref:Uncharacterized protein n=1 Tax=Octopus bimaculoides TaxID=37653 RepID=A0A0L8HSY1_OCTBM